MKFKVDPADRDWLGADRAKESEGFVILRSKPTSPPAEIVPAAGHVSEYVTKLDNPAMRNACHKEGKEANFEWVLDCAATRRSLDLDDLSWSHLNHER